MKLLYMSRIIKTQVWNWSMLIMYHKFLHTIELLQLLSMDSHTVHASCLKCDLLTHIAFCFFSRDVFNMWKCWKMISLPYHHACVLTFSGSGPECVIFAAVCLSVRWRQRWEWGYSGRSAQDRVWQRFEEGQYLSSQLFLTVKLLHPHKSMRTSGHVWGCISPPTLIIPLRWI